MLVHDGASIILLKNGALVTFGNIIDFEISVGEQMLLHVANVYPLQLIETAVPVPRMPEISLSDLVFLPPEFPLRILCYWILAVHWNGPVDFSRVSRTRPWKGVFCAVSACGWSSSHVYMFE